MTDTSSVVRDATYGLRLMRKQPLTTAAAILAIALGVGANTAMFTVVNTVLLQLPFENPDRLVSVLRHMPRGYSAAIPVAQFRLWADRVETMESLAGYAMSSPVLTGAGQPETLRLECFSASMFPMLGVAPAVGRTFAQEEDAPGAGAVIVVSHAFWVNRLGADPLSVGRALTLNGLPVTVIGVMPKHFDGPRALSGLDGWLPLEPCLERNRSLGRSNAMINAYGRLRPDITTAVAEAQLDAAVEATTAPEERVRVHLTPLTEEIYGDVKTPLLALFGAAGFVLLIACANVASLLIGRAEARRKEFGVRVALGCSRTRMVRQLLTESLLFAMCGGAAGLLVANWSLGIVVSLMPGWIRRVDHIAIDSFVLAACVALSAATGFLFGLLPAVYASRTQPGAALRESALLTTRGRRRMRGMLIVAEVALSVALLTGAGLLIKTFLHLRPVSPGFVYEGKVTATISLPRSRYPTPSAWTVFLATVRQRLAEQPGVRSVVATSYVPLSGFISIAEVQPVPGAGAGSTVYAPLVTHDYFGEMGIPIVRGRGFVREGEAESGVAIVNESMARRMWPGADPLGQRLTVRTHNGITTRTIVGVSRNVRDSGQRLVPGSELYLPIRDEPAPVFRLIISTPHTAEKLAAVVRHEVAAIDPLLPVDTVESFTDIVARSVAPWRFASTLMASFAGIAGILAAVGLFAVIGGWVTERTPEIGVRMALGAGRGRVLRLFLAQGVLLTAAGIVVGVAVAALTTRFLKGWLVNASPLDGPTFAAATATMTAVCLLATYLAARRAASIDPIAALRS